MVYVAEAQGDRVAAYQLGSDGLLVAEAFSSLSLENPRRLALDGDAGVLYVALKDQVVSLALGADGALPEQASSSTAADASSYPLEIVPTEDVLYVAATGNRRVETYELLSGGALSSEPVSTSGTVLSDYRTLAVSDGFLYAASRATARIDTFLIGSDGSLSDEPETQLPETLLGFPEDITVSGGVLYAINQTNDRINAYQIAPDGLLPEDPGSKTDANERYSDLLVDGSRLYATAYHSGRIDLYQLDPSTGALPSGAPGNSTYADTASFPAALAMEGGILYVAQAGLDRIDAYIIGSGGKPSDFPSSSTDVVPDSFPTDLEVYTLP